MFVPRQIGSRRTVTTGPLGDQSIGVERGTIGPEVTVSAERPDDRTKRPRIDPDQAGKMGLRSSDDTGDGLSELRQLVGGQKRERRHSAQLIEPSEPLLCREPVRDGNVAAPRKFAMGPVHAPKSEARQPHVGRRVDVGTGEPTRGVSVDDFSEWTAMRPVGRNPVHCPIPAARIF
jgi:hypothetical protein